MHKCLAANRKEGAKFAFAIPRLCVAGGRNSFNAMKEGSVVLDLSKLRSVKYDQELGQVKVQGGARVIDVDSVLAEYGQMAVLGTCQHLGVVGCILAGGLGFASRKYGLACDNVVSASIILADGRLKKCNKSEFQDILWSICGGGGGIGVVVSITLKTFPIRHAALFTCDLVTPDVQQKRMAIRRWCNWACGDVDNDHETLKHSNDGPLLPQDPAADEVFSQLTLLTDSGAISFLASSVDTDAVCQTDGFVEQFAYQEKKAKKTGFLKRIGNINMNINAGIELSASDIPSQWKEVPSLAELITNKFSVSRKRINFEMVRYADQLQSYSNQYYTPGNIFSSVKFAKVMTNRILEVLVQATSGDLSPKNESKIYIMAMGGRIAADKQRRKKSSFSGRDMNYMIYIEGKWDAVAAHKVEKEKAKVKNWVHWIVKKLHLCEGIQSSAVPESMRDLVSKSGNSKPPPGWYNFSEFSGRKLNQIKNQRDPRNVFSFASRVSWSRSLSGPVDMDELDDTTISTDIRPAESVKDGEIQPTDCLTPQKQHRAGGAATTAGGQVLGASASSMDGSEKEEPLDDEILPAASSSSEASLTGSSKSREGAGFGDRDNDVESSSIRSDLQRLLSITDDSDEDLKDWSLAPVLASTTTPSVDSDDETENNTICF